MIVRVLAVALAAAVAAAATAQAPAPQAAPAQQAPLPQPDKNTLSYALGYDAGLSIVNAKADSDFISPLLLLLPALYFRKPSMLLITPL